MAGLVILIAGSTGEAWAQGNDAIQGVDLSGTYVFDNYLCINATADRTVTADIPGLTDVISIQGNSYREVSTVEGCTVTTIGRIVFQPDNTFALDAVSSVPSERCSVRVNFILTSNGERSSVPFDLNFTEGERQEISGSYVRDGSTGILAISEPLAPIAAADVVCLARYNSG